MSRFRSPGRLSRLLLLAVMLMVAWTPVAPSARPSTTLTATGSMANLSAALAADQTIRIPLAEPPTIDPGLAEDVVSLEIIFPLFDALVTFDDRGTVSGLGAASWTISPDGLTYTFALRPEARWSDGQPVTAHDYVWAWQRNIDPATASSYANTLFPVRNAVAINDGTLAPDQLGVVAADDYTLVVTLEEPAAYFLRLASTWAMMPLRQDVIERAGDRWTEPQNIVTNGAFTLKEWQHDRQIVLERNDAYWGPQPTLQRAIYRLFPEGGGEQVLAAYEAGDLDTFGPGSSFELPPNQVDRIVASSTLRSELAMFDQSGTRFFSVNTRQPYLQDPRVRMALGLALDRPNIISEVLKRPDKPAFTLQPEGIVGRRPSSWPHDDVAQARQLLAEAGYPDGQGFPELTLTYNTSDQWKLLGEYLQQHWKETLGINLKLESMEFAVFLKWRRGDEWVQKGDLYVASWFSDYEDSNNWYNVVWDSQNDPQAFNLGWQNSQYDALVRQAAAELDPATRQSLYGQAEEILAQGYPAIPLFHYVTRTLVKPNVQGYQLARVLGVSPLSKLSITAN